MKKQLIFVGLLAVGFASAQTDKAHLGKVGINIMTPQATIDIRPNADNSQETATTNEGILTPKLSKTRVANIEDALLVEGTLVYVTDEAASTIASYTGNNAKVAKITEKGYYYYNGTEWVKSGAGANEQEWAYDDTTPKVYLKKQSMIGVGAEISYTLGTDYKQIRNHTYQHNPFYQDELKNSYIYNSASSSVFSLNTPNTSEFSFMKNDLMILPDHVNNAVTKNNNKHYTGLTSSAVLDNSIAQFSGNIQGGSILASAGYFRGDDPEYTQPAQTSLNANLVRGLRVSSTANTLGKVNNMQGISNYIENYRGADVEGFTGIGSNVMNKNKMRHGYGMYSSYRGLAGSTLSEKVFTYAGKVIIEDNAIINEAVSFRGEINGSSNGNIKRAIGIELYNNVNTMQGLEDNIGVYVADINGASNNNFAIHTGAGAVRFGDLAGTGNREVYVDENGVLKAKTTTIASNAALWVEDIATNSIKLAVNSDGTTRTNAVSITDGGMVLGSSFRGTNGATIFPDYVFQKYYTGNSSIKADYTFKSLSQVEDFVKTNGHLPGYKSAEAIKAQGYVDLMETQLTNVEKIEELYLHSIEQEKNLKELRKENEELKTRLEKLEKLLK